MFGDDGMVRVLVLTIGCRYCTACQWRLSVAWMVSLPVSRMVICIIWYPIRARNA